MELNAFLEKITRNERISFTDTMAFIAEHYHYRPTEFSNGLGDNVVVNPQGINEGSCKIFTFARMHQLTPEQTLNLFGDYYWVDVVNDPNGTNHPNIRNFMRFGWNGIRFTAQALQPLEPGH